MQPPTTAASADAELNQGDGGGAEAGDGEGAAPGSPGGLALAETEKDRLIRRGLLTPFDRLAGFARKVQNAPAAPPPAAGPGDGGGGGGSGGGGPSGAARFQATGFGSLRHLGRAELQTEKVAAASTRSGRTVGEAIEEAGRQALEARAARRTAKFMELEQLPQQAYGTAADGRAAEEAELQDSDAEDLGAEPDPDPDPSQPDPDPEADEDVVL
ncbi:hypothetical protein GPECTOR_10g1136 [Gonium pectorale]|uniref:Uncharacterized protein n=1 Tax=Gonium pectorale TaxID=33097 RepID=A0A150GQQ1_GONPE|nr:hypothetical protein GPECTOR_10g1136 [Gonium pectorale]|eukprot:KXZ52113.1 hypothetical protein GPECTOR_10g1136 [Gonium pectorale]